MNKKFLEIYVENSINDRPNSINIEENRANNSLDLFYQKTANRLLYAYYLYGSQHIFFEDLLLALRDYLLVFGTSIEISTFSIPDDNSYAIKKNIETNKYFATFQ